MTRPTAVLFCPGRGSYTGSELGWLKKCLDADLPGLDEVRDALAGADEELERTGRPTVTDLDGDARFRPSTHLDGENAAALIYFATLATVPHLEARHRIVAVGGLSMGWYTALAASGALSMEQGWTLVSTMARLQKEIPGGQILTTTVGEDWHPDAALLDALDTALAEPAEPENFIARSIRLGGHEVIAGTDKGLQKLLATLPEVRIGERTFPFQLAGHGPFHTPLCAPTVPRAQEELRGLAFRRPRVHLIDGLGNIHSPWSANPADLWSFTTQTQVVRTFDFSATVRTGIREFCPDALLCARPGTSLRAPVGHVVLREGYRRLRDQEALFASNLVLAD